MAASDHLGEQFMFHVSPAHNRESIMAGGLDKNQSSIGKRVYLSDEAGAETRAKAAHDVWKVDVSGIPLRPDLIDNGTAMYSQRSIPASRLELHQAGTPGTVYG